MKPRPWHILLLVFCVAASAVLLYRGHQITEGRNAFERLGCAGCHIAGGAPSLEHVGSKYDRKTFVAWVSDPETIYARVGHKPLNPGYMPMPRMSASPQEIEAISWFLSAER